MQKYTDQEWNDEVTIGLSQVREKLQFCIDKMRQENKLRIECLIKNIWDQNPDFEYTSTMESGKKKFAFNILC